VPVTVGLGLGLSGAAARSDAVCSRAGPGSRGIMIDCLIPLSVHSASSCHSGCAPLSPADRVPQLTGRPAADGRAGPSLPKEHGTRTADARAVMPSQCSHHKLLNYVVVYHLCVVSSLLLPEIGFLWPNNVQSISILDFRSISLKLKGFTQSTYTIMFTLNCSESIVEFLDWHDNFSWIWQAHLNELPSKGFDQALEVNFCIIQECEQPFLEIRNVSKLIMAVNVDILDAHLETVVFDTCIFTLVAPDLDSGSALWNEHECESCAMASETPYNMLPGEASIFESGLCEAEEN
jgi:hypothetical protein